MWTELVEGRTALVQASGGGRVGRSVTVRPFLIGSEIYRSSSYGHRHPLAIPRVCAALDLIRAMGWLDERQYVDSPVATAEQLARFHDRDYIAAVMQAEADQQVPADQRRRYNIGCNGNPVFPEIFRRPATACGGTLRAVELLGDGGIVFNPAGGTHHGRRDRASGFCYFNDPVLGILSLLDRGIEPIYYVDVDAHHGDGVEDAFAGDGRVFTLSIHEAGRWPYTGKATDRAGGTAVNLPVPAGFNDGELAWLLDAVIGPVGERLRPAAIVLQCGADGLADDPMSRLALSNRALWRVVRALLPLSPRLLVLGGGGYNPWAVARCWAGVWATLNGIDAAVAATEAAARVLRGLRWHHSLGRDPRPHWMATIADPPQSGAIRGEVRALAAGLEESRRDAGVRSAAR
jgi:acetoin utilization protein AcuC